MRSKADTHSEEAEKAVRDIRRATRRQYSAEEKVRIVIAGLRGEDSVAELCRKDNLLLAKSCSFHACLPFRQRLSHRRHAYRGQDHYDYFAAQVR
jgi:hypothetical protein